jgi:hypothetical protein
MPDKKIMYKGSNRKTIFVTDQAKIELHTAALYGSFPVKTKRARREAKKLFKKQKQTPAGWYQLYKMETGISMKPTLPAHVVAWLALIDEHAKKMFKRPYDHLTDKQKSQVHESFNTGAESGKRETIH